MTLVINAHLKFFLLFCCVFVCFCFVSFCFLTEYIPGTFRGINCTFLSSLNYSMSRILVIQGKEQRLHTESMKVDLKEKARL